MPKRLSFTRHGTQRAFERGGYSSHEEIRKAFAEAVQPSPKQRRTLRLSALHRPKPGKPLNVYWVRVSKDKIEAFVTIVIEAGHYRLKTYFQVDPARMPSKAAQNRRSSTT